MWHSLVYALVGHGNLLCSYPESPGWLPKYINNGANGGSVTSESSRGYTTSDQNAACPAWTPFVTQEADVVVCWFCFLVFVSTCVVSESPLVDERGTSRICFSIVVPIPSHFVVETKSVRPCRRLCAFYKEKDRSLTNYLWSQGTKSS